MYDAQVVRVLIASPADVPRERAAATEVIFEWNIVHSERTGVVLLPVRWETHSSPELGDRAQSILNRQILEDSDLLVAIFWTRMGTPTGVAPSGTAEEIQEHVAAGKLAMLYFSNAPAHPESVDEAQIKALREFRDQCMAGGLCEFFEDPTDFRQKFARQLALAVHRYFAAAGTSLADVGIVQPPPVKLSEAATELLVAAAKDREGEIRNVRFAGGFLIVANGRQFNDNTPRSNALWTAALDELVERELVKDADGGGRVFEISQFGFNTADQLGQASAPT